MAKKKANGTKRKKANAPERRAIEIQLIPFGHLLNPDGELAPFDALTWLRDELPGYQRLIRLGLREEEIPTKHSGSAALAYGVEGMTAACVEVLSTGEPVRLVTDEDVETWSALRALDGILGAAFSADWRDFGAPTSAELGAIMRLVEGGLEEVEGAHKKAREIEGVLDGPQPEKWSLSDLAAGLAGALGKEGVVSLLCDFDSRELRAFIRACHQGETETRDDVRRVMFGEARTDAEACA